MMERPIASRPEMELTDEQWKLVDEFHVMYYNRATSWLGFPLIKAPWDLIIYQEIITQTHPQTIIECGTGGGGSALFFASILALLGQGGQIISIDVEDNIERFYRWAFPDVEDPMRAFPNQRPHAPGLNYLHGNSIAPSMLRKVKQMTRGRTMVVLDSFHTTEHVLDECELYAPMVSEGCYLVVEDINICGHPVPTPHWPDGGPYDAVETFLPEHPEFTWDSRWVGQYLLSYNAHLRRKE